MLPGFKTFIVGLALAVIPQAVSFVTSFDFVHTFGLSPNAGTVIGALMMLAGLLDGATASAPPTSAPANPSPLSDAETALRDVVSLATGMIEGKADLSTALTAFNAVQKAAIDVGIEPPAVANVIAVIQRLLPGLEDLYEFGLVQGGYRPLAPDPSDHNFKDR